MSSETPSTGTAPATDVGSTMRAVTQDRYGHSDVLRLAAVVESARPWAHLRPPTG